MHLYSRIHPISAFTSSGSGMDFNAPFRVVTIAAAELANVPKLRIVSSSRSFSPCSLIPFRRQPH